MSRTIVLWVADGPSPLLPGMQVSPRAVGGTIVMDGLPTETGYVPLDRASASPQAPCTQGRSLGRFAAHELGHMLLRTVEHTDRGLMRAGFDDSDLKRPSMACEAFRLTAAQRETVQRELASGALLARRSHP